MIVLVLLSPVSFFQWASLNEGGSKARVISKQASRRAAATVRPNQCQVKSGQHGIKKKYYIEERPGHKEKGAGTTKRVSRRKTATMSPLKPLWVCQHPLVVHPSHRLNLRDNCSEEIRCTPPPHPSAKLPFVCVPFKTRAKGGTDKKYNGAERRPVMRRAG